MKFKSLTSQIAIVFLTLILAIQLVGLIPIDYSINKNARKAAEQSLQMGERVFIDILAHNTQSLNLGAKILASDFGFRDAVASNDRNTVLSALSNHQARIGADIAFFYATQSKQMVVSGKVTEQDATKTAESLISSYNTDHQQIHFEIFDNLPYQLVAVPVKAPLTIGWIIMGFKIDHAIANKLHQLSNLEVTFIQKSVQHPWKVTASTLNRDHANTLVAAITQTFGSKMKLKTLKVGGQSFHLSQLTLHHDKNVLITVLQRSVSDVEAQFQALKITLYILVVIGLIIFAFATLYVSKLISAPIAALSASAKKLGDGNYDVQVVVDREDEIGQLGSALNAMREAIAVREKRAFNLAYTDQITGLPNKSAFEDKLHQAWQDSSSTKQPFTVMQVNLDRFRQVNKIMGNQFGDTLLKSVGALVQAYMITSNAFVARVGTSSFAILVPNTSEEAAVALAKELSKQFDHPLTLNQQSVDVHLNIGVAIYPHHGENDEQLFHNAETAMQSAMTRNANVVKYSALLEAGIQESLTLATELKEAIHKNQLSLYLQPKINISTQTVYAAEALVRWIHPKRGFIFPDKFIPFAEQTGIIQKVTLWMLEEACKVSAMFKAQGIDLCIAINISARDLIDQTLPDKIATLLKQHQVTVAAISLEVTESSMMDDPKQAEAVLRKLAAMGLNIAIDDFGTGYSSLGYLKHLPVQELKIDKSFVLNMEKDENDATIVRSTIDLGHNLNLKVVAEGIENIEAWNLLASMGCDYGQGYYMGKPMPVKDFGVWLERWQMKVDIPMELA